MAEFEKTWLIFPVDQASPISLRAIPPADSKQGLIVQNLTFTADEFPDVLARQRAFADAAMGLNAAGYNIYTCLNPISPIFTGNRTNGQAVRDIDIACRTRLLIDLDRARCTGRPASDEEIANTAGVADRIADHLASEYDLEVVRVMSGNGLHLYLPLDNIPNTDVTKACCQRVLQQLARRFDTAETRVDTSVFNAARITKVPGTIARKGQETADSPYRMAIVL